MKSPYRQRPDDIARADTERFIERYSRAPTVKKARAKSKK